jgi:hypothetical protein
MSAWSKAYLGWVKPKDVTGDLSAAVLKPYEKFDDVYLLTINPQAVGLPPNANVYYLISNRQKVGFDSKLPGSGLLILRVNESVLKDGLANNNLNTDPNNMGVAVVEADGLERLIHHPTDDPNNRFRGGPGDTFPGSANKTSFENSTSPATSGKIAVCNIRIDTDNVTLRAFISKGVCVQATGIVTPTAITLEELASNPQNFASGTALIVKGTLKNEVANYFRDPTNLVLRDEKGSKISVSPWVAKEAALGQQGARPPTLAEFLGHEVELIGKVEVQRASGQYVFHVDSARVLN